MTLFEQLKLLPKIELHVHLDGSVNKDVALSLINEKYNIQELEDLMVLNNKAESLTEYLEKFDFPISLMQDEKSIEQIATTLAKDLKEDNVIYAEVRFAPMFHTKKGLTQLQVVESVIKGIKKVKGININLILCCMRNASRKDNLETIEVAKKLLNKKVVAVDLAGDENKYSLNEFSYLFDELQKHNIPYTIHAGEIDNLDGLEEAISFNPTRIGHGVIAYKSQKLMNLIKNNDITLEICPTSNIQTNLFDSILEHPIYHLYKEGLNVTINTDNRTVSDTNLLNEYCKLVNNFPLTIQDIINMNVKAINASFLSEKEKSKLMTNYLDLVKQVLEN